jgi:hypothetical protein
MKISTKARLRHALVTTLVMGTSLHMAPAWADGTPAGVSITNKATATFTDGTTDPLTGQPTTYATTSNEVVITVSEVAGISLAAQTPSNATPIAGSTTYVDFVITNTGNDPTQFFIPGAATLTGGTNFTQSGLIQIVAVNGTALPTAVAVPAAGGATGALLGAGPGSIKAADPIAATPTAAGTVTIRVYIAVAPGTPNTSTTTVTIGNTAAASATPQNDTRNSDQSGNVSTKDIYTFDNPVVDLLVTKEGNAIAPNNGIREAMVTSLPITVGARPQAFAAVLKSVSAYAPNNPNDLGDDLLTYGLSLRVDNPSPAPAGLTPSDLHGTALIGLVAAERYVLVSDSIPAGLQLAAANPTATAAGWRPVYSTTIGGSPLDATWSFTRPGTGTIRVGFVYDTIANGPIPKGVAGTGTTVTGFTIVTTPITTPAAAAFKGGTIANIAQAFGQSGIGPVAPGTPTQIVYDESGDQTSNNGLDGSNPNDPLLPAGGGGITPGVADPAKDGSDPGNNTGGDAGPGSGTNPKGGEDNIFTIAATPLNGPAGQPGATGPTNNNDDFTNKSIIIPAGIDPATPLTDAQTTPKTFDNTVQNTSGSTQVISLLPTPPATGALPTGTKVTIVGPTSTATYIYNGTAFVFDPTATTNTGGTSASVPVRLTIPAGGTANYQTIVDLPGSTPGVAILQFQNFPVPITAFIDGGTTPNGLFETTEPNNITINRLYTNYLKLLKEARILEANGTPVTGTAGNFGFDTAAQVALSAAAIPGRIIEYRITYSNVSTTGGAGSTTLPANNLVITENGSAGGNTWGINTLDPKYQTLPLVGSAIDTIGPLGTITIVTGGTPVNITEYKSTVPSVIPGATGTFTFQRQIK